VANAKPFNIPKREVWEAFKKVKANQGAARVDGQTIAEFEIDLSNNLYRLWNRMSSGSYFPLPVRRVDLPKGDGRTRPLGIPTVGDRVAQEVGRARTRATDRHSRASRLPTPDCDWPDDLSRGSAASARTLYSRANFRRLIISSGTVAMLSGFNSATLTPSSIKGYIMATKAKTKAGRVAERKTSRSQSPNLKKESQAASTSAIDLLEQDHRQVEEWFDEYDELKEDDDRKAELVQKICLALKVHAQIEEEIFYPQAREATKDNDLIDEAVVEHATVKNLIADIESIEVGEDLYDAKIRVLGEMVKQHIKEEEEELFPELEPAKMDLEAFGKELAERKEELISEMQA
jgi:hemerythrin superfamily protein